MALKHAVDAWVAAPAPDRAARFAAAEAVRWLEWGANSFFQILLGLTLLLFGVALGHTAPGGRQLGWVGVAAGLCLIAGGVVVGQSGFTGSPTNMIAYVLFLVTALGLLVVGLRQSTPAGPGADDQAGALPADAE